MSTRDNAPQGDISRMLIEFGDAVEHSRAKEVLKQAKIREAKIKDLVSVKVDKQTTLLMSREKAIKKGYITEE